MDDGLANGCFIEPTVFAGVTSQMTIAREEIFGPVLSLIEVKDLEEALAVANDTVYVLCSSIYTSSLDKAHTSIERSRAGMVHVNPPTALRKPQLPFGGIGKPGAGLPEAGKTGTEFFTHHKTVYVRYQTNTTRR